MEKEIIKKFDKKYIKALEALASEVGIGDPNIENDYIWFETWTDEGEDFIINIDSDNLDDLETELYHLYNDFDIDFETEMSIQCKGHPSISQCIESNKEKEAIYKTMYEYVRNLNKELKI